MTDRMRGLAMLAIVVLFGLLALYDLRNGTRVSPSYWVIIVAGLALAVWGFVKKPSKRD